MSLETKRPIYTIGRPKQNSMIQRFSWKGPTEFIHQFTIALERNKHFPQCDENEILDTDDYVLFLRKSRRLFDEVMTRSGYNLDTFTGWSTSGITRFTLRTIDNNDGPVFDIGDDPSTIHYDSVSDFHGLLNKPRALPLIDDSYTKHVCWFGAFRYVSLVQIANAQYVRKTIDPERPESLKDWRREFLLLNGLQECPYTVNLAGLTKSRNPYSPSGEEVITAFLLEYGTGGTLKDFIGNVGEIPSLWMLQVAKGLREMHRRGIIHGDLKPDNIIITESGQVKQAKIIDLAQSGYTKPYHAPEFPKIFQSKDQWRSSVDIYSYGVVYCSLLFGDIAGLLELSNPTPISRLIAQCVAIDPLQRPSAENIVTVLECLSSEKVSGFAEWSNISIGDNLTLSEGGGVTALTQNVNTNNPVTPPQPGTMARKRSAKTATNEALIQQALKGIKDKTYKSAYEAAKILGVRPRTLYDHVKKGKSRSQARVAQQHLLESEEQELVRWIRNLTISRTPAQYSIVREMAEHIRNRLDANVNDKSTEHTKYPPLGQQWVQRFLLHHPQLKSIVDARIEVSM